MICGYLEADVKRVADDLLLTDEGPPPGPPEPEGKELKVSRTPKTEDKPRARSKPQSAKSSGARPKIAEQKRKTKRAAKEATKEATKEAATVPEEDGEEPTLEFVAVGAVGALDEAGDGLDWGFEDDPSDYSAAV
jgi:hypothetical protein